MKPRLFRYLGIALLTIGILGVFVTQLNNGTGFLADPGYYPARPGGPPWSSDFGPYVPPRGWQDPEEIYPENPDDNTGFTPVPGPYFPDNSNNQEPREYSSNGESIYYSLVTLDGEPILAQMRNPGRLLTDLSCAGCHGNSGRGGFLQLRNWSVVVPAIDHQTLRSDVGGGDSLRPAYTDESLKVAITRGIDSRGKRLDYSMPRFQLRGKDLDDLISFLKTLNAYG